MKTLRTQAIVLRRTNYGEADRVLQIITPVGKRSVMAKGVRREKSKLAGGIELFAVSDVVVGEGKGELGILLSARLVKFYQHIMADYDRMQFGYEAVKLVARASEMLDEPEWYDLLLETLASLDSVTIQLDLIETWFYLRYAGLMGHELNLAYDVDGNRLSPEVSYEYDVAEKGLRQAEGGDLTAGHIKLLRLIATKPIQTLVQVGGIAAVVGECLDVARRHSSIY